MWGWTYLVCMLIGFCGAKPLVSIASHSLPGGGAIFQP